MKEEDSARPTNRPSSVTLNDAHFYGGNHFPLKSMEVYEGTASPGGLSCRGYFINTILYTKEVYER